MFYLEKNNKIIMHCIHEWKLKKVQCTECSVKLMRIREKTKCSYCSGRGHNGYEEIFEKYQQKRCWICKGTGKMACLLCNSTFWENRSCCNKCNIDKENYEKRIIHKSLWENIKNCFKF